MTDTLQRPPAQEDGDEKARGSFLGLSPFQLIGGALAATTTAVISSFLGVAGTLLGAALASIVTTVGGALYSQSLDAAHGRLVTGFRREPPRSAQAPVALRTERLPAGPTGTHRADESFAVDSRAADGRGVWSRLRATIGRVSTRAWLGTAVVFLMAIVAITGFELATGKPVSATVTGSTSSGTTISTVVEHGTGHDSTGTTESDTPSGEATPTSGQTEQDSPLPDDSATTDPQGGGSVPDRTQTVEPAAPAQTEQPTQPQEPAPAQTADPGNVAPGN